MHQVLVIDDDLDVRDAIRRVLERAGYGVTTSADAVEAVNQLNRQPVHVVITDIIMPKVNGVEAIRTILKDFPEVRIIAISGGGNFGVDSYKPNAITTTAYLAAAERAGAHYVLSKPFESAELVRAVEQVLGSGNALH
ncbi:MAG: two-component system, cell cycle response regulator CpdR [Gammaproteobacteria bacterium]|jgi:CheY-like chemotaxis protein|nr:response regulator receiver protein [Gammaproteobacteria bacterium]MEA3138970.1 two-component system, cell cycle response regulator CpdR [Gammaproteobacteria bacterium]